MKIYNVINGKGYYEEEYVNFLSNKLELYRSIIDEAIKYNKELCELYDCGMELSNAQTNLFILEGKKYELERKERGK